jgi:hypothetical protein
MGMTPLGQRLWIEVRGAVELCDSLRDLISMPLYFLGMLQKFRGDCLRMDSGRHIVMAFAARNANQFCCCCLVEGCESWFLDPPDRFL